MQNFSDLRNSLSTRVKKLNEYGLSPQPLPIANGPTLDNVTQYLVSINGREYELESAKAAVDITFRSFYALQLQYPREAEYSWMFLENEIYYITGEGDKEFLGIRTLQNDLASIAE